MRYFALIDGIRGAYGAAFPDLPGCTAMGKTLDEVMEAATESLGDWARSVESRGFTVPAPSSAENLRHDPEVASALAAGASLAAIVLVRATGKSVRANLSLDEGVVFALDAAAHRRGITRSAMVEIIARQHLPEIA